MKKNLLILLTCIVMLCSCGEKRSDLSQQSSSAAKESGEIVITEGNGENDESLSEESAVTKTEDSAAELVISNEDMFTKRDSRVTYEDVQTTIYLNGSSASCESASVQIEGSVITITDEGTYIVEGTLDEGMIIVNAEETDKPQIVLRGASITSEASAAIYIVESDKVFVTLEEGTENVLTNGGSFEAIDENNIDAVIFSKQDLTLNGSGSLTVNSPAGHGIVSKDDLVLTGGDYVITSASHGLDANDSVRIKGASLSVASGKDGIRAENSEDAEKGFVYIESGSFEIAAEGDGISAGAYMQIKDGEFDIVTGGGSVNGSKQTSDSWGMMGGGKGPGGFGGGGGFGGMSSPGGFAGSGGSNMVLGSDGSEEEGDSTSIKGLKAEGSISIEGGSYVIDSADDAIHANGSIYIEGGSFEMASGDDGIHANEALTINECTMNISESYEGLEALDIAINGGSIALVATDDGLNAAGGNDASGTGGRGGDAFGPGGFGSGSSDGSIVISGGDLYMQASGDGVDANGTFEMTDGYVVVCGPNSGDTATLDYDVSGTISGGTFIGSGSSFMAQTFSDSDQGVIACSVGSQSAGSKITVKDGNGNTMLEYEPELAYSVFIFSSEELVKGESYTLSVGSQSGEIEAN